jgi:hypothetical protein
MSLINPKNPLYNAIVIYIIIIVLIVYYKPVFMFDKNTHKMKDFGFNDKNKTLITFPILSIMLSIIIYASFVYINNVYMLKIKYERILTMSNRYES